jgi:hypothetical protein
LFPNNFQVCSIDLARGSRYVFKGTQNLHYQVHPLFIPTIKKRMQLPRRPGMTLPRRSLQLPSQKLGAASEASNRSLPLPSPEDMNSCTLAQARAHLREVVIKKGHVTGQAKEDLEARRLSLSEHVTRLERAESKKKDAARRGEIFHLRLCYINVIVKNTKLLLLLLLLLSHHRARHRASIPRPDSKALSKEAIRAKYS